MNRDSSITAAAGVTSAALVGAILTVVLWQPEARAVPQPGWIYAIDAPAIDDARVILVDPLGRSAPRTIASGTDPDLVLSPDGRFLYVTYSKLSRQGHLEIYDTASGDLVARHDNPERWVGTLPRRTSQIALTADGRYLLQLKWRFANDYHHYYVDAFDTARRTFLAGQAAVPLCQLGAFMVSTAPDVHLMCFHTQEVFRLVVTPQGVDVAPGFTGTTLDPNPAEHGRVGLAYTTPVGGLRILGRDGSFLKQESPAAAPERRSPRQGSSRPDTASKPAWLALRSITEQVAVVAPHQSTLFAALEPLARGLYGRRLPDRIAVLDAVSLEWIMTIVPSSSFVSLTRTPDGAQLVLFTGEAGDIIFLDAASGHELRSLDNVGRWLTLGAVVP